MDKVLSGYDAFAWYTVNIYTSSIADAMNLCKNKIEEDICWKLFLKDAKNKDTGVRLK